MLSDMKEIEISELTDNFFQAISKEWMLITAGTPDKFNMMTASWGCVGWLWGKPVATVFIRPERYTHQFVECEDRLTLSFLGNSHDMRKAYAFCGSKSGRDYDKLSETGLHAVETPTGAITFQEARLTLCCRKLYKGAIRPENFIDQSVSQWYGEAQGGYHDVYVLEIEKACMAE